MQNLTVIISLWAVVLAVTPAMAAPQDKPVGSLAQQIQAAYPATVMDGAKVTQAGTILVVKKEGLQANPLNSKLGPFSNDYEDGQVGTGTRSGAIGAVKDKFDGMPGASVFRKKAKVDARALAVDEKVYLLKVDVKPNEVIFLIQSCGSCEPGGIDPGHHPSQATVHMQFVKGFQTATDLKHVQASIGELLALPDSGGDQNAQAQPQQQDAAPAGQPAPAADPAPAAAPPAEPAQHFDPVAPPPPPPADPVQISLGQTVDQVTAALGTPQKVVKAGTKEIYVFKDLKVTFVKGKVTDVE